MKNGSCEIELRTRATIIVRISNIVREVEDSSEYKGDTRENQVANSLLKPKLQRSLTHAFLAVLAVGVARIS